MYEYAPQDLGRTMRDPSVVRSHAHIKAWAKMLLEGIGLMLVRLLWTWVVAAKIFAWV